METIHLSARARQALFALFLFSAIAITFFATKAWGMGAESAAAVKVKPSVYDEYVRAKPAITTTTTTTTTVPLVAKKSTPPPAEAAPVRQITGDIWEALRNCEAGGNYSRNSGNGYYGAYQFSAATWRSMGTEYEYAHLAPPAVQDDAAVRLQARSGWGQWPACTRMLGLR